VLKKVLEERSSKHLNKFASKVRKSVEKYTFLNNIEEKSFVRLEPSKELKKELSISKA
jgi:hypothetical protein